MAPRQTAMNLSAALFAALILSAAPARCDDVVTIEYEGFAVVHMSSLPPEGVDEVASRVENAIRRVTAWLSQAGAYEGSPYKRPIRVLIDPDQPTPTQMRSTIFVPEARIRSAIDSNSLAEGDFGIVHEVTHVLAASAYRKDRNRFYDDGLAVYLQQKFGPAGNYPARGPDLHLATATLARSHGSLIPLAEADQARRESGDRRRLGYLQLGSFTQFLVENYGIDAYLRIYRGDSPVDVTGLKPDVLEERWRALIQSL